MASDGDPRPRVLVADDDPLTRRLLEGLLQPLGYGVVTVPDGDAAWRALQDEDRPPVAILDWMMPGASGVTLCRRVRAEPELQSTYIILLTGRSSTEDLVEGLNAGADEYLVKPVDPTELRARLGVAERVVGLERSLQRRLEELERRLEEIRTLEGLVPICMYCKKIRDQEEYWRRVEDYVSAHTHATFSHGICPDCVRKVEAELDAAPE